MLKKKSLLTFYVAVSTVAVAISLTPHSVKAVENSRVNSGVKSTLSKPIEMQHINSRIENDVIQNPVAAMPAPKVEKAQTMLSQAKEMFGKPFSQFNSHKVSEDEMEALKDEKMFPKPFSSGAAKVETSPPKKSVTIEKPIEESIEQVKQLPRPPADAPRVIEMVREEPKEFFDNKIEKKPAASVSVSRPVEKKLVEMKPLKKPTPKKVVVQIQDDEKKDAQNEALKQQAQIAQSNSQATNEELAKVRSELAALEKENRALYLEARKARGQIDAAVVETSNEALKKLRAYEKKLEASQADNLALSREIEALRRAQEDQRLGVAGNDPTAQDSIRRFNESEREIQRLGKLLEQQRIAHRQEKIELENMLFDPAVTDEAQRKKLSLLENKLSETQTKMKEVTQKTEKINAERQLEVDRLSKELSEAKSKEEHLKREALKIEAEAKRIAAAEAKLVALMEKEEALKLKEQRLKAEEKEISEAEAKIAMAQQKQKELAQAQAKMKLQEQKMLAEKARMGEVKRKEQELLARQAKMKLQEQKMLAEKARLAELERKEQKLAQAEKALKAQEKALQAKALQEKSLLNAQVNKAGINRSETTNSLSSPQFKPQAIQPSAGRISTRVSGGNNVLDTRSSSSFHEGHLKSVLNKSGISSVSAIRRQGQGYYYWKAAGMTGKAQIVSTSKDMREFVQSYIAREKQNCRGDFASLPASLSVGKTGYELACVGANSGKSSSILFKQNGKEIIAIAHETTADNMDAAIDARDKVAAHL